MSSTTLAAFDNPSWGSRNHLRRRKFRYAIAASHHLTFSLGRCFPKTFPLVFVLGFPKSGTSWVCQLIAEYMRLPFPQNSVFPIGFPAVVHGHETVRSGYANSVYVVRDGRDAMVSLYFHLQGQAAARNPNGVGQSTPPSFEDFVRQQLIRPAGSRVHWGKHFQSYHDAQSKWQPTLIQYESLLRTPVETMVSALERLTGECADQKRVQDSVDKFAFDKQRVNKNKKEDRSSYLRKGKAGDWRNYFTPTASHLFAESCGDMLVAAGYETNNLWTSQSTAAAA